MHANARLVQTSYALMVRICNVYLYIVEVYSHSECINLFPQISQHFITIPMSHLLMYDSANNIDPDQTASGFDSVCSSVILEDHIFTGKLGTCCLH